MLQNFTHLPKFPFLFPVWKYDLGIAISYLVIFFLISQTAFWHVFMIWKSRKPAGGQMWTVRAWRFDMIFCKIPSPDGKNLKSFKVIVKATITKQTPLMASFCQLINPAGTYLITPSLFLPQWLIAKFHRGKMNRISRFQTGCLYCVDILK